MKTIIAFIDRVRTAMFDLWAATPSGNLRLVAFHDAVVDADDTLEAVIRALDDGHTEEALRLAGYGRESIKAHLDELKGML